MSLNTNNEININDEWTKFINTDYNLINMNSATNYYDDDDEDADDEDIDSEMNLKHNCEENISANLNFEINSHTVGGNSYIPKCSDIYISTKTKIAYLNMPINLNKVFWEINVLKYMEPKNGVIKKQMKFNSTTLEELDDQKVQSCINYVKKKMESDQYNLNEGSINEC